MPRAGRILVTGATGYVGDCLVPRLLAHGYPVRVLARDVDRLRNRPWRSEVQVCEGDVGETSSLEASVSGIDIAYYLTHSMTAGGRFAQRDVDLATKFARAARAAGVRRIIYLGGLGEPGPALSEHLRSRQETGATLARAGVPVTELRAAVIVGAGSISFEMIRYLTERIPLMICPRWVFRRIQPIAIVDVLAYLVAALEDRGDESRIIEIGGADVVTYGAMLKGYARRRGLWRILLPVPVLTPKLSSHWVHWTTPVPAAYARPLIEGLRSEVVVANDSASQMFGSVHPIGYDESLWRALEELHPDHFEQVAASIRELLISTGGSRCVRTDRGMIVEVWRKTVRARPPVVWRAFCRLGGAYGWLHMNWAWRLRASLDRLVGGASWRRNRPARDSLREGDRLDFFRVEAIEPERSLLLRVEMKLPGAGWLQFETRPLNEETSELTQTIFYAPRGLFGLLYWYLISPVHRLIFAGLLKKLADRAEAENAGHS